MDYLSRYDSPLGPITLSSDGETLTGLWFDGQKYYGATLSAERQEKDLPVFTEARRWLDAYFAGKDPGSTPPLNPRGTPFQKAVWDILRTIPRGSTLTYGDIGMRVAQAMGRASMSAQAVGNAVGHNPISSSFPVTGSSAQRAASQVTPGAWTKSCSFSNWRAWTPPGLPSPSKQSSANTGRTLLSCRYFHGRHRRVTLQASPAPPRCSPPPRYLPRWQTAVPYPPR